VCVCVWVGVCICSCDVASLVPMEFWERTISKVKRLNPDVLFIAESITPDHEASRRRRNLPVVREGDLYDVGFDYLYDYDLWHFWIDVVEAPLPATALQRYIADLDMQISTLPALGGKLRFTDNHDNKRCARVAHPAASCRGRLWT
jgi:hypothetical protein